MYTYPLLCADSSDIFVYFLPLLVGISTGHKLLLVILTTLCLLARIIMVLTFYILVGIFNDIYMILFLQQALPSLYGTIM